MVPFSQLEITISKVNSRFKAKCSLFPHCSGTGKTEDEALSKLSDSISKLISKVTKEALGQIFSSNQYTEVILDMPKKNQEQCRVFSLDSVELTPQDSFQEFGDIGDLFPEQTAFNSSKKHEQIMAIFGRQNDDSFFGFPLNFN